MSGNAFNAPDAVVHLGVGKNMVSGIRFWLKAFGLTDNDAPTELAHLIFADDNGFDRFLEDTNTLWLLHYSLVSTRIASLYHLLFLDFQRERKEFDRTSLQQFVKRSEPIGGKEQLPFCRNQVGHYCARNHSLQPH